MLTDNSTVSIRFEIQGTRRDVNLKIQQTTDFVSWETVTEKFGLGSWSGDLAVVETPSENERIIVVLSIPRQDAPQAFYRMIASRP